MLESLKIKNLALIKEENIEFRTGLSVILGETGSGKSLIFDAINFVTGQKSDRTLLRSGEKLMKVDAFFTQLTDLSKGILKEFGFEDNDEVLISRTLSDEGKSVFRINGETATASMVKNLSKTLLESVVQHESVELFKTKNHLLMLDKFAGSQVEEIKGKLFKSFTKIKEMEHKVKSLGGSVEERERTRDLLSYQISEIERADLDLGEDDEIKERLDFLANAERIYEATALGEKSLSKDSFSALNQINEVISALNPLTNISSISESLDRLVSLRYEIEDIAQTLTDIKSESTFDEVEFNKLDARMDLIKSLKKKYGGTIEEIITYHDELKEKLNELENSDFELSKLNAEICQERKVLDELAGNLTEMRKKFASEIEKRMIEELFDLGMKNTAFKIEFKEKEVSLEGKDEVEFTFSANKGQDLKNLAKTASGGEASRIMLAIKNIFASIDGINTLIFDEVDAGISGEVGNMVAEKLLRLSKDCQVICITHLPQVSAVADNFLLVSKNIVDSQTLSNAMEIQENQAIDEIARLIGGNKISPVARKHAEELRTRKFSESK